MTLALILGVGAGAGMAAIAGGRRALDAHLRLIDQVATPQLLLPLFAWEGLAELDPDEVTALPDVERSVVISVFGDEALGGDDGQILSVYHDPDHLTDHPPKLLAGRLPRADAPREVLAPYTYAERFGLHPGSEVELALGEGRSTTLTVVGISVSPPDLRSGTSSQFTDQGYQGTAAFLDAHPDTPFDMLGVHLAPGTDVTAFQRELDALTDGRPLLFTLRLEDHTAAVQRSNRLQAVALFAFGGVLLLSAAVLSQQAITRHAAQAGADDGVLWALGASRRVFRGVGVVRTTLISAAAAGVAAVVAIALSPLAPLGTARVSEPDPGFHADLVVLGIGVVAIIGVSVLGSLGHIARHAREAQRPSGDRAPGGSPGRSAAANWIASRGVASPVVTGVGLATSTSEAGTAPPIRGVAISVAVGVGTVAMALTFGASLSHLFDSPPLWGGVVDGSFFSDGGVSQHVERLRADRRIEAFSIGTGLPMLIDDLAMDVMLSKGSLTPPILEGRAPGGDDVDHEILVGTETLRALGKEIGETVRLSVSGVPGSVESTIVGRTVFPAISDTISLGRGAFQSYVPVGELLGIGEEGVQELTIRVAPGADRTAVIDEYARLLGTDQGEANFPIPQDLLNFGDVEHLPVILAGTLAMLALLSVAHALVVAVRRRRRDLALLAAIGYVRGQRRRAIRWLGYSIVGVGVLIGLPVGIVAGRWAWVLFADRIGVIASPQVPFAMIAATIPPALALVALTARIPSLTVASLRPAVVLRGER